MSPLLRAGNKAMNRLLQWLRDHRPHLRGTDLVGGNIYRFDKDKSYLIALDNHYITREDCDHLTRKLIDTGMTNVICIVGRADPTKSIVIMEQERL